MPTVSWIREGDLDRFLASRPFPTIPAERFFCPICKTELPSAGERARHLAEAHPLERPGLFVRGQPARTRHRIRASLSPTDIVVASCDEIRVDSGQGSRVHSAKDLVRTLTRAKRGRYELELVRRRPADGAISRATYRLEIDIPTEDDLGMVDRQFVGLLARSDLAMTDVERFVAACGRTTAIGYVDALCNYVVGTLLKEQNPGSGTSLPFDRFVDKLRTAFEGLAEIERPLAATVRSAIRLGLNDFGSPEPDLGPRSTIAEAYRFFAAIVEGGATIARDETPSDGEPICPIDTVTADLMRLVLRRSRTLPEPEYRDLMRKVEASEIAPWDRTKYAVLLAQAAMARGGLAVAGTTLQRIAHDAAFGPWAEAKLAELS